MTGLLLSKYRYAPPAASHFSTLIGTNSVNPTITDSAPNSGTTGEGTVLHYGNSIAAGSNIRGAFKSITATSDTIIARIRQMPIAFDALTSGLALSDGTKIIMFGYGWPLATSSLRGPHITAELWTNNTTLNSTQKLTYIGGSAFEWWKITFAAHQVTGCYVSDDGVNWIQFFGGSAFLNISLAGVAIQITNTAGFPGLGSDFGFLNLFYYSDSDITPPV